MVNFIIGFKICPVSNRVNKFYQSTKNISESYSFTEAGIVSLSVGLSLINGVISVLDKFIVCVHTHDTLKITRTTSILRLNLIRIIRP